MTKKESKKRPLPSALPSRHAKTARGKRFLESRESQVVEPVRRALFIRSSTSSLLVNGVLHDLWALKKPHGGLHMHRNKSVRAFDESSAAANASLEFFAQKEDATFAVVGSHSKKRPNHVTLVRFFDGHVLEQCELAVKNYVSIAEMATPGLSIPVGVKPVFAFNGAAWSSDDSLRRLQNILIGCFQGPEHLPELDLRSGLQICLSFSLGDDNVVSLRVFQVALKKSGTHVPAVRLAELGPRVDFVLGRTRWPEPELWKEACRQPRELAPKKLRNIEKDSLGNTFGRVHVGVQDLGKLQTRKMKALKAARKERRQQLDEPHDQQEGFSEKDASSFDDDEGDDDEE